MNTEWTGFKKLANKYFRPFLGMVIAIFILCLLSSILNTIPSAFIGKIIESLKNSVDSVLSLNPNAPTIPIDSVYIWKMIAILITCFVTNNTFFYIANVFIGKLVQGAILTLRGDINTKINHLPVSYFDSRLQGNILTTVTNDVDAMCTGLQQSIVKIVCALFDLIVSYIMMIQLSLPNGLLMVVLIPVVLFFASLLLKFSRREFLKLQNTIADLTGYAQEHFAGFTVNKLNNRELLAQEGFKQINDKISEHSFRASFSSNSTSPVMDFLTYVAYVIMILLTTKQVFAGTMGIAEMFTFLHLVWLIYAPLNQITQVLSPMQSAFASMKRIQDFLEEKEETADSDIAVSHEFSQENFHGNVSFDHVKFHYNKNKPLITDLSFEAKAGQKIAIVGPTGAGKTTLINLLMRFYDPVSGVISVDGHNTRDMKRADLRSLFGMVLQDTWLYHSTIRENIRFGNRSATDEEIVEAAKIANVDHFIRTLPSGYDMMLDEESSNISTGQKQLLTIARVIIANPKILILDEATSSVDTRLERLIQEAMDRVMKGKTSFVIAHRLSTIKNADLILVMDNGDIVESGTHDELLEQGGLYSSLYLSQFADTD